MSVATATAALQKWNGPDSSQRTGVGDTGHVMLTPVKTKIKSGIKVKSQIKEVTVRAKDEKTEEQLVNCWAVVVELVVLVVVVALNVATRRSSATRMTMSSSGW